MHIQDRIKLQILTNDLLLVCVLITDNNATKLLQRLGTQHHHKVSMVIPPPLQASPMYNSQTAKQIVGRTAPCEP